MQAAVQIQWCDQIALNRREVCNELLLSAPWLVGSIYSFWKGWFLLAIVCSFFFFLTGLRQSHGAQHYSLGVPRRVHECVLFALSCLMLASMHAVQVSHLHHHRHSLDEEDLDGKVARLNAWQALTAGPWFILNLHRQAWSLGSPRQRRWIAAELICVGFIAAVAAVGWLPGALACHVSAMLIGECFTAFFAVWIVHHHCADAAGRTQRGYWLNRFSYNMFLHREHHLWPRVPTAHLPKLAERLDLTEKRVPKMVVERPTSTIWSAARKRRFHFQRQGLIGH